MKKIIIMAYIIVYIIVYAICFWVLVNYEEFWGGRRPMNFHEEIFFYIYKYFLNFPLSFFNLFSDNYLHLTLFFVIPNAISTCFIVNKVRSLINRSTK